MDRYDLTGAQICCGDDDGGAVGSDNSSNCNGDGASGDGNNGGDGNENEH